jgi:hypothetical protein
MTNTDTKNVSASHYDWSPSASIEENHVLETVADDGALIHLYVWSQDSEVKAEFVIDLPDGKFASTACSRDWDKVGEYVPRSEWPSVIYAGKKGPKHRNPDPAVNDLIQQVEAEVFLDLLS